MNMKKFNLKEDKTDFFVANSKSDHNNIYEPST